VRKTLLALVGVACVVPALAFAAADPKKDSHYSHCTAPNQCPLDFDTNKLGTKIINLSMYPKCSPVPVGKSGVFPPIAVNDGKFDKQGSIENLVGDKITYHVKGKFTRPKKAVGTYNVDSKDCSDRERDFVAKRDGEAKGGF
jgi:hypothetical protein